MSELQETQQAIPDKYQAIDQFWNSFGWTAYDESTVPDDAAMPRITYSVVTDSLGNPVMIPASLWDRSTSWEAISKKAEEISWRLVNMTPPAIKISTGRLYLTKGSPFAQRMQDADETIRRMYLNVDAEFFTAY